MQVLGQFRDLDDPDSFVWLRGFSDMPTRKRALEAFYGGPTWKQHAGAANATMIDSDNVLLLRPVSGLVLETNDRPAPGSMASQPGLLVVTIYPLTKAAAVDFPAFFARELEPALHEAGMLCACDLCHGAQPEHLSSASRTRGRRGLRLHDDLQGRGRPRARCGRARTVAALARSDLAHPRAAPGWAAGGAAADADLPLTDPRLIESCSTDSGDLSRGGAASWRPGSGCGSSQGRCEPAACRECSSWRSAVFRGSASNAAEWDGSASPQRDARTRFRSHAAAIRAASVELAGACARGVARKVTIRASRDRQLDRGCVPCVPSLTPSAQVGGSSITTPIEPIVVQAPHQSLTGMLSAVRSTLAAFAGGPVPA